MTDATVNLPRSLLQIVFDCAVNSMDFGSGFLDDEEVTALRAVAELLGVDPMDATPNNFKCRYGAGHELWGEPYPHPQMCMNCRKQIVE